VEQQHIQLQVGAGGAGIIISFSGSKNGTTGNQIYRFFQQSHQQVEELEA
jgi:hypothetical protein